MHFVTAKGILSSKNGMNVYRGCCSHGCIYCDKRELQNESRQQNRQQGKIKRRDEEI